jgi:hypothetical protein
MSGSYVDDKVREALLASKGSRATAQKILMAWAVEDPQLLLGISKPFLKAIAAAAVERGIRRAGGGGTRSPQPAAGRTAPGLSKDALAHVLNRIGREPDVAGTNELAPAHKAASAGNTAGHEKSMMAIAKAFAAKKIG